MKKKYIIPTLDVMEIEVGALLEASLPLKNEDATDDGMSRDLDFLFTEDKPLFML